MIVGFIVYKNRTDISGMGYFYVSIYSQGKGGVNTDQLLRFNLPKTQKIYKSNDSIVA